MRATCQRYRRWLTTQDPRGAARAAEHVAGCGECAELLELYTGGVAGLRGVAAAVVSPRRVQSFLLRADHATAEEADAAYGAVARRYQRGTDALIGAVAEEPEVSAVRRFVAAADERFRPRFQEPARWRWSWALPLAAAAAAAVVVALWVGAPQDEPRVARPGGSSQLRVAEVAGSVTMAGATGMEALALGGEVLAGRTLTTSREGALGLRDHETAVLALAADGELEIDSWQPGHAALDLRRGRLRSKVEPRTEGQAFEVRTEYAVVTVVGTEFVVDHRPGDRTVVEGISGEVRVASLDGRLLGVVRAGDVLAVPAPQVVTASVDAEEPPSADLAAESEVADSLEVTDSGVGDGAASGGDEAAPPRGDGMERPRVAEAAAGSGLGRAGKPQGRPDEGPGTAAASRQLIHASTGSPPPSGRAEPRAGKTTAAVAGQGSGTDQGLSAGEPPQGSEPEPSSGAPVEPEGAPVAPDDLTPVAEPAPEVTPDAIPKATPEPTPEEEALAPETAEVPPGQAPALPPVDVVEQATALLAAGKDAQAVALLEAAPAGSWRVAAALGDAYAVTGRPAAAAAAYRDALSRKGAPSERVVAALATVLDKSSPAEALTVWRGYLRDYPKGRMAARARLTLAKASLKGGEVAAARSELESLLASHPGTPQATTALALLGRTLLDQRMWSDAGRLFQSHVSSTTPARAEIALVGLIRVRLGQGDRTEAGSLIAQYDRRFPRGARREEVAHLRLALEPR